MEQNFAELQFNRGHKVELTAREVAKAQKFVIFAFLLNLLVAGGLAVFATGEVAADVGAYIVIASWVVRIVAVLMAIYGIFKIASELDWPVIARVVTFILLVVPLVNLLTLLVVNGKATAFLKKAGYKVGLAGAHR